MDEIGVSGREVTSEMNPQRLRFSKAVYGILQMPEPETVRMACSD